MYHGIVLLAAGQECNT